MSAVDAPPGLAFAGVAAGELVARRRSLRLARAVFWYVAVASVTTYVLARRHWYRPGIEVLLSAPLMFLGIAVLGYAVRRARLRVDNEGFRWGWDSGGFRMSRERVAAVVLYDDALALLPRRGSTWYVSARDWAGFPEMARVLREAEVEYERVRARAPLGARLQSYGLVLDLLLVGDMLAATMALGIAFAL
jgi:hypothetical protein